MDPSTSPGSNYGYDFILNPAKPAKRSLFGGDPFIAKVLFLVGGAVVLMIVIAVVVNVFFGSKTNTSGLLGLTQNAQEIIRLSDEAKHADSQDVKNAAINTKLTITSQQYTWLTFLAAHNAKPNPQQLSLKKDPAVDTKLTNAVQSSTFDKTYTQVMRTQLTAYATTLKNTYQAESNAQRRKTLSNQYDAVQLLLRQWPS